MNVRRIALAFALTLSASAAPAATQEPGTLRWDCARTGAPGHHEIAAAFGYDNHQYMREAQPRLYREVRRECARSGAGSLLVVLDGERLRATTALAAR
jgi:hypothetical protein